jgi:hypothetical protein
MTESHSASQKPGETTPGAFQKEISNMKDETPKGPDPAEDKGSSGDNQGQARQVTIIVNAREKVWTEKEISFDQVVKLAFPTPPPGENIVYTITYRRGEGHKPEGTMTEGESVKVKDGMIFNVTATDKS